jgi:hypothetical protein
MSVPIRVYINIQWLRYFQIERPAREVGQIHPGRPQKRGEFVSQNCPATPLGDVKGSNDDQNRGIDIARRALESPLGQIAENADHDGAAAAGSSARGADAVS